MNEKNSFEIGHGKLREFYKEAIKQLPDNPKVGLVKREKPKRAYLDFQFYLGEKRVVKATKENFTYIGIQKAIEKAHKISQKLANCQSELDFWDWWKSEIEGKDKGQIKNDLMTFGEAIALVDAYYWDGYDNNGNKRVKDRENPMFASWDRSWLDVYGNNLKLVPQDAIVNWELVESAINKKEQHSKARKGCVDAFKKLAELSGNSKLWDKLNKLDTRVKKRSQTDNKPLQTISLDDFLDLHKAVLEYGENTKACHRYLDSRKSWLWVFSMQAIYGFRISEVFAIINIDKPYKTRDGVIIPALNDPNNKRMVAVMAGVTVIGTSTKTGKRMSVPMLPPDKKDLIEKLGIKNGKLPDNRPKKDSNSRTIAGFFCKEARQRLLRWQKQIKSTLGDKDPLTQTHALRHLANLNGIMAGISLEQRALNLGHSSAMNDSTYVKRQATETTLKLLTTQNQAIPLEAIKPLYKSIYGNCKNDNATKLIAGIYGLSEDRVSELLE